MIVQASMIQKEPRTNSRMGISVHMISRNGGFGFQVIGGADANYHPEVEMVLPGKRKHSLTKITTLRLVGSVSRECCRRCRHTSWGQDCQCQ